MSGGVQKYSGRPRSERDEEKSRWQRFKNWIRGEGVKRTDQANKLVDAKFLEALAKADQEITKARILREELVIKKIKVARAKKRLSRDNETSDTEYKVIEDELSRLEREKTALIGKISKEEILDRLTEKINTLRDLDGDIHLANKE